MRTNPSRTALAACIALALTACGGGGGGSTVRPDPPPSNPPPSTCEDASATNYGDALPCEYRYSGAADNILVPTNVDVAHEAGFTGKGVKIGLLDDQRITPYPTLDPATVFYKDYTGKPLDSADLVKHGHGSVMGAILAGQPAAGFAGGVAPDASIYRGRVCYDDTCTVRATARAVSDLTAKGVRLFSMSFGSTSDNPAAFEDVSRGFGWALKPGLAADALFVGIAGNASADHVGVVGAVPHFMPEFADNFLVGTAVVINSNGEPVGLEGYANQCGYAAQWCLSAPGLVTYPAVPGTKYTGRANGTSNTAPQIAGTAALVWQAFPWMSAHNVQQTILTTATDIGQPGVDSTYGWGFLNAGAAVHGPGQFTDTFAANVGSGSYTFTHDIFGAGGLTKTGGGSLTLKGDSSYAGLTDVQGGTLALIGSVAGDVATAKGATFASLGGSIGGDYSAANGANTAIQVGTGLTVGGTAKLDGNLTLLAEADGYAVQATETILTAGDIEGTFDDVLYGSGFFWSATLNYTATQVQADLVRASAMRAASANHAATQVVDGGRLADTLLAFTDDVVANGDASSHMDAINAATRLMSAPTANHAEASLASLTGQVHGTTRAVAVQQALNDARLFANRVATLTPRDAGAWAQISAVEGDLERDGYADARYHQGGVVIGIDRAIGDDALVGVALSGGRGSADLDALGGRSDSDYTGITAYGRFDLDGGVYLAGQLGVTHRDVDTARTVLAGTDAMQVTGEHDDSAWQARLEAGRDFDGIAPFVAVGAVRHHRDSFSESGGDGLGLASDGDTSTTSYADLGVRLSRDLGRWTLRGSLVGRWLLAGEQPDSDAWFAAAPQARFTVKGQPLPDHSIRAAVGVQYRASRDVQWFARVGGEWAEHQSGNTFATAGVRVAF